MFEKCWSFSTYLLIKMVLQLLQANIQIAAVFVLSSRISALTSCHMLACFGFVIEIIFRIENDGDCHELICSYYCLVIFEHLVIFIAISS